MKRFRTLLGCCLLLVVCAGGALAQSVQTDFDRSFNLNSLRTYAFMNQDRGPRDPLAGNSINDRRIREALDTNLKMNNLSTSETPDFWIKYFVTTKKALDIQDNRYGIFQRMGRVDVNQVTEGTLIVMFVDSKTQQEVWRGYATGVISPKDLDKNVAKAASKLVEKFKKNQAGKN